MTERVRVILAAMLLSLAITAACGEGEHAAEGQEGAAAAEDETAAVLALETILTNINDPAGEKHARVQVKLAIAPEASLAEIQGDALLMARLHDRVLTLFFSTISVKRSIASDANSQ